MIQAIQVLRFHLLELEKVQCYWGILCLLWTSDSLCFNITFLSEPFEVIKNLFSV